MGLEVILTGLSAVVGLFGAIGSANAAASSAAAQKEASAIKSAQTQVQSQESRRQRIREQRIRRAQIIAASENQGTSASSGEIGAIGSLNTNLAGMIGTSLGESKAAQGINTNMQKAADFASQSESIDAWTNVFQSGIKGFQSIFD
jgi:hypothetical protein